MQLIIFAFFFFLFSFFSLFFLSFFQWLFMSSLLLQVSTDAERVAGWDGWIILDPILKGAIYLTKKRT